MQYEIFHDVMEAEMVMTGLCDENFKKHIRTDVKDHTNKSLLKRMNTMKQQIMTKRFGKGYVPENSDDSSSSQLEGKDSNNNDESENSNGEKGEKEEKEENSTK